MIRPVGRIALGAIAALVLLWFGGYLKFIGGLPAPTALGDRADAIVVLTGRPERLQAGFDLLREGRAKRMLISGVGHGINARDLGPVLGADPVLAGCCVDLGHEAQDTIGNAIETAAWAARGGVESMIVVTSVYHAPRGLIELGRAMPRVRLSVYPVVDTKEPLGAWWRHIGLARILSAEYSKYLVALARARFMGEVR